MVPFVNMLKFDQLVTSLLDQRVNWWIGHMHVQLVKGLDKLWQLGGSVGYLVGGWVH